MNVISSLSDAMLKHAFIPLSMQTQDKPMFDIDTSIEGMSTQQFGVGIFYFLIFCIVVFVVISFLFMFKDSGKSSKLKKGEKLLFIWIMFGVLLAVVFGAAQMMHGFLF